MSKRNFVTLLGNQGGYPTPAEAGSQTAEWDASKWATSLYTDAGSTLATAEDDVIYRLADLSGNTNHMDQATESARGLLKLNIQNGLAGVLLDGTNDSYATAGAMSTMFGSQAKTAFIVAKVVTIGSNSATQYANDPILSDLSVYWGIHMRSSGPLYHYNYDGSVDVNESTIANGEAVVLCARHDTTNIYLSKNGGAYDTDASGATSVMTGTMRVGVRGASDWSNIYFLQASLHNADLGASVCNNVVAGLKQKWGIS